MPQGSFSASVDRWVAQTKERQIAVRNESAQRVIAIMQTPVAEGGNMPVDTGFLRASLTAVVGDALLPTRENPGASVSYDPGPIWLVIAGAAMRDPLTVVYTANSAVHQNYGAKGRAGRMFVDLAAQQWPRIVSEVVAEAKTRAA